MISRNTSYTLVHSSNNQKTDVAYVNLIYTE